MSEELKVTVKTDDSTFWELRELREAIMDYVYAEGIANELALLRDIEDRLADLESSYRRLKEERDRYNKWWREEHLKVKAYELLGGKK